MNHKLKLSDQPQQLAVLKCKVRLSGSFLSPQLFISLTFKTHLRSASPRSQLCLIPTTLTACFVKDEVI